MLTSHPSSVLSNKGAFKGSHQSICNIFSGSSWSIWAEPPLAYLQYFIPVLVQREHNRNTVKPHKWIYEVLGISKTHCVTPTVSELTDCSCEYIQQNRLHLKMLRKCVYQWGISNRHNKGFCLPVPRVPLAWPVSVAESVCSEMMEGRTTINSESPMSPSEEVVSYYVKYAA